MPLLALLRASLCKLTGHVVSEKKQRSRRNVRAMEQLSRAGARQRVKGAGEKRKSVRVPHPPNTPELIDVFLE